MFIFNLQIKEILLGSQELLTCCCLAGEFCKGCKEAETQAEVVYPVSRCNLFIEIEGFFGGFFKACKLQG